MSTRPRKPIYIRGANTVQLVNYHRPLVVTAIFPDEGVIVRLVGALLLEQNVEWAFTHRT